MMGIRSFMGWSHVPDIDSSNPSDDNPFAGPSSQQGLSANANGGVALQEVEQT